MTTRLTCEIMVDAQPCVVFSNHRLENDFRKTRTSGARIR